MMLHLARGFRERGYHVDLVLARAEGPYLDEVPAGVELVELNAAKAPGYAAIGSLRPLVGYLRSRTPDALLSAMSRINIVSLLAGMIARTDTTVVVSERNHLSSYVAKTNEAGVRLLPWLVRLLYPRADGIVPISNGVADDLATTASLPLDGMTVIYNPVVIPEIEKKAAEPIDHDWFTLDGSEVIIGVGALSRQKGFPTLVRGFAHLRERRNARLVILGEGDDRDRIESVARNEGVADDVWLPGFVNNPYKFMRDADVFALSSEWEGFGNVMVEAMACGTPVVATNCPSGPAEILSNGKYGPLVPVGDHMALAQAIETLLENSPPKSCLWERANDFRYDVIADRYLDVLFDK
jgi:glycosyltransferase involved in cell wall biosynthesis